MVVHVYWPRARFTKYLGRNPKFSPKIFCKLDPRLDVGHLNLPLVLCQTGVC